MVSTAPSVVARDALRRWLRTHTGFVRTADNDPGRMTRAQLRETVLALGGDPDRIIASHIQTAPQETATVPLDSTATTTETSEAPAASPDPDSMLESIKDKLVEGGFGAVRQELRDIIARSQRPAEVRLVEKIIHVPAPEVLAAGAHDLRPARTATWGELFGITEAHAAARPVTVWDHPDAPKANPDYVFPAAETALALSQLSRSEASRRRGAPAKHVLLIGPAGTGKSAWPREFAARTGRPFVSIPMSDGIEVDQLMGQTLPDGKGGARWQDGLLLAAMRQPGMVVCLDEVGGMRPAVGVALNGLLQDMTYYVPDTGERVAVARGVSFVATNNASLMDGGQAKGYVGVGRQNRAFADRFGASIEIGYAPEATEIGLLVKYTGCTATLAKLLVDVATLSRAKAQADQDGLTHGIGLRRLIAWAECLSDGVPPDLAFKACVLNASPEGDHEVLRQLAVVAIDPKAIASAIRGTTPKPLSRAGMDFTDTQEG